MPLGRGQETLPGGEARSDIVHDLLAFLAEQMIDLNKQKQTEMKGFLVWLERQIGVTIDQLNNKSAIQQYLGDYQKNTSHLDVDALLAILGKNRRKLTVDPVKRAFQEMVTREYTESLTKLLPIKQQLATTDRLIDQVVYRLYGLTEAEIAVVEGR